MRHATFVLMLLAAASLSAAAVAQAPVGAAIPAPVAPSAEAEVRKTLADFVAAMNALDQQRFDSFLADDVTLFFPRPPFPIRRVAGKAEVASWFKRFFDSQRGDGPMEVEPLDLHVQAYGDVAVATFHLGADERAVSRRTLVLRKGSGGWKIVHLHASALAAGEAAERG